jgi:hypoxanthine phosphoribosyltransferase
VTEPEVQLLYDSQTIQNQVKAVGRELEADLGDEDPLLISVVGGSVVFLADLVRAIQKPIRYEFIQVQYSAAALEEEVMEIHYPISMDVTDQTLVIVKDVVTTGVIETYLANQFLQRKARRVAVAALLDLPEERRTDFRVDFRLFTPKKPGLFVGYGLKTGGRYGNLAYIGRIAEQRSGIGGGVHTLE